MLLPFGFMTRPDYILIRYSVVTREEYEKEGLITAREALDILESRDLSHSEEPISFKTFYRMLTPALFVVTTHWEYCCGEEMPFQYAEELVRKK